VFSIGSLIQYLYFNPITDSKIKVQKDPMKDQYKTKQALSKSELGKAEQALKESEKRAWSILENIQEGYYEVDLAGNYTFFNSSMSKIIGYPAEEMMGMNYRVYVDEENAKKIFLHFNEVYRTGLLSKVDYEQIKKDGSRVFVETSVALMRDSLGQPTGFRGIVRDITERKRMEEALQKSEEYFKEVTENSSDIIIITERNGNIKYCSRSIERYTGYKPEELIGSSALTLIHPDDVNRAVVDFGRAIRIVDSTIPNAFRIVHKDGSERYLEGLGKNLFTNPSVAGFIMNVHDMTDHKKAEEQIQASIREKELLLKELQASKEGFHNIVERETTGIVVTYKNGIIGFANPAAKYFINRENDELVGEQFFIPMRGLDSLTEIDIVRKDGTVGAGELQTIETEWGGESAYLTLISDVTERKVYEASLIKTAEEHKKLDELKSEFIAIASHELRTPLTSIKNAVDIMAKGKAGAITDGQEKFLSMAQRSINRLSTLINDMLNIAKIESGKMRYQYKWIDLRELLRRASNRFQPLADQKTIALCMDIPPDLPIIFGDVDRIEEVLINLVGNAIKFTPEQGTVTIDVHQREAASNRAENVMRYVEMSVADTGIGIPEEHKERLFEKFYQAAHSLEKQDQSGTGLGLAVCKGIIEGHKGKIWYESIKDKGSTFHFTLPLIDLQKQYYYLLESDLLKAKQQIEPLSILLIEVRDLAGLKKAFGEKDNDSLFERIKEKIISGGIKTSDKIAVSLPDHEIMLIMPNTDQTGVQEAQKRIRQYIIGTGEAAGKCSGFLVASAATYPEDGISTEELVDFARGKIES